MSFIDLMASHVWSEYDIQNRTEAMIASQFPRAEILKRKVTGMMLGQYQLTPEEQAEFQAYAQASFTAGIEADAARADMALLQQVLAYEATRDSLAMLPPAGEDQEDPDGIQREQLQAVLDGASDEVKKQVVLRTPTPMEIPAEVSTDGEGF